ncbi:nicotinate-nucleotide adenylyltransferase [Halomonas llamarensis]|uniref:Probable nicotinate-nucleotide adenylyltransferase n=1 Tax=Halomonas llamarensis TaxID=2945104 RepID=A0ABT0SQN9_9GAMM|nr:nicotinate-nucleotide adenylyltransferase [Halomonas llamarensis]MCL7930052.1 nicotinate-nucleotide adenylyltransferase [Halomonas llamarensis]
MTPPARTQRIGMFGGTFDPVHLGHLRSGVELCEALELDQLHMMPAPQPPLRDRPQVSAEQRLALLKAGIGDTPRLIADDRELCRDGPSYSLLTLEALRSDYGTEARLIMALGQDAFLKLADWYQPERLFELAHIVVMARPGYSPDRSQALLELLAGREVNNVAALMATPHGRVLSVTLPSPMGISATGIRQRLARRESVRYLLPEAVEREIAHQCLYRLPEGGR